MRRKGRVFGAVVAAVGLLVAGVQTGTAVAAEGAASGADYWTPERMRQAEAADVPQVRGRIGSGTPERGAPERVAPTAPAAARDVGPAEFPQFGGEWTGGGAVTRSTGRIFMVFEGTDPTSCTGTAVTSANRSTVITAGHCMKWDKWHTNWIFVPGYHDGQAPYGKWPARKLMVTPQWEKGIDLQHDIGAAVVAPLHGKRLTDVVGGRGLSFNGPYGRNMYSFGYPLNGRYDGEKLIYCSGLTFKDPTADASHANGMSCDMMGGASGGPWYSSFDEATGAGLVSSVNSFGYVDIPNVFFGPYFGDVAKALYKKAQRK